MQRTCSQCSHCRGRDSFSNGQWSKGPGASRCFACVHGGSSTNSHDQRPCRTNDSTEATFDGDELEHPFAEGSFRWVARGHYVRGQRAGQPCVCKWFKTGQVFEADFFEHDIKAVDKALDIISRWNHAGIIDKPVRLNKPEVWTFKRGCSWAGRKVLQEPFVENWEKFNSNTGWNNDDTPWPRVMQALSHFSYHASSGSCVLCDLQGGVYRDGVVLSDPVVLSRGRQYGVTDLGVEGISSFFSQHQCNEFCRAGWSLPRDRTAYYRAAQGTTMVEWHAPTRQSRQMMTGMDEGEDEDEPYYGQDGSYYQDQGQQQEQQCWSSSESDY